MPKIWLHDNQFFYSKNSTMHFVARQFIIFGLSKETYYIKTFILPTRCFFSLVYHVIKH